MKFIIAKKIEMSQEFAPDGTVTPVTVFEAGPIVVTQVKNKEKDGYQAVQVGFGNRKKKNISKPVLGHLKELGSFAVLQEFLTPDGQYERGQTITVETFVAGDKVDVSGISGGCGFAGVVKRHSFHGHPATHGHKDQSRMPGSIGSQAPQHVFKGKRMGGRMGGKRVTVKNLEVIALDKTKNILKVKGAVPGKRNSILFIKTAKNFKIKKNS
ncbi:MAG: 50S ribosomal protein L3 [Candidatus Kerfeldbacteria bacterium RIFOXYA2_FULL_38_24]|uniref:Large ribosomal subunit protein uL3 n=1 Tax=Candidatus Kerfeldbacteria bacterium RIFOXYB2_FULL_38_14 TaxID=1798547 RepID=A0A1G2BGC0_9BACT|nr:MAG: 50S ribosomal protein L3 [Candidatus Kerfeldbacteria bacterium RIFOXYB2_FULL_38_14]OGY87926.1 MAG: 50S ribosomal protein L3 [Candidatus Kerfeldbacteria bacterium RIFOXYA2_FULL_38_24]OGY88661.1 MAG: 50S ribosomal protein L3 [Candidatus Kerfeldbacteria bacterium RIFOXYC2_FULL_38_9]